MATDTRSDALTVIERCDICDGSGDVKLPDPKEPKNKRPRNLVVKPCFNCDGKGEIEWDWSE